VSVGTIEEMVQAYALREVIIADLRELGAIRNGRVAQAFRAVPRHLFAPGETLEAAYAANSSVVTRRDERGVALSTVSAAHIQATMLEQAALRPGMRVLVIGSGGCNAALIAEMAGEVTSIDIDPKVVDRARHCLAAAGYDAINLVVGDAEGGVIDHAPYDRVIVTAGAWDIPGGRTLHKGGLCT
jgi:protein-L-isoaspartate(D-aspartate) O-methyltransferase